MIDKHQADDLAAHWIEAWNSHDLDRIMEHYSDDVVLTSPVAARLLGEPDGTVRGKVALHSYFARGLEFYPQLRFELRETTWGVGSLVLFYTNQNSTKACEFMEIDKGGKISRVVANYSGL